MNMIEVDPKLFITCRLCVEETGVYQIVPEVQKKIKYCFDLNISLLDGLPPLICKKCELMLSSHAQIKDMLHEKQKNLIKKFKENPVKENITEDPTSKPPVQQIDIQNDGNNFSENKTEVMFKNKKCKLKNHRSSSIDKSSSQVNNAEPAPIKNVNKSTQNGWRKNYKRQFVCRFCSMSLRHKKSMICHSERCVLLQKYADVYKWCWVQVTNINSKSNLTESTDHIVYERNKIVNTKNPNYYVIYSLKLEKKKTSSESSDENFVRSKRKRKRQRLISESSNETLVIDNVLDKENNKTVFTSPSDIECVTLDDSDNASTVSTATLKPDNLKNFANEKMVNNIVSICYNKYLKRYNIGGNYSKSCDTDDSFLQRKLLSIGRKIIHKDGFIQTGLLRYLEQKDLDVTWIPKLETNVSIRTTLKMNNGNVDENNLKSLSLLDNNYKSRDFVDIFEQKCTSEADSTNSNLIFRNDNTVQEELSNIQMENVLSNNNIDSSSNDIVHNTDTDSSKTNVMDTQKVINTYEKVIKNNLLHLHAPKGIKNVCNVKKLLNPNPVANPKKLTKKAVSELTTNCNRHDDTNIIYTTTENSTDIDECSRLPIITSTVSLAPSINKVNISEPSPPSNEAAPTTLEAPLPRIKVKPVSELMAAATDKPKGAPVPASVWAGNSNEAQKQFVPNILPSLLLTPSPVYVNLVQPNNIIFPQTQISQINNFPQVTCNSAPAASRINDSREYIIMHTVELPSKKTHSPFLYFKELLQIHNMNLMYSAESVPQMCCIMKFKLRFEQTGIASVTLCLSLLYDKNTFCIQVKDLQSRTLDVNDFSAYWQWEVLKGFRGDVISLMLQNAKKLGNDILEKTTYFVSLLSNIIVQIDRNVNSL